MADSVKYKKLICSSEWRKLRNSVISEHPVCQRCGRVASRCVHHVTPVESGVSDVDMERLAYSRSNLVALCYQCHKEVHLEMCRCAKKVHKQREAERFEQWKSRIIKKSKI